MADASSSFLVIKWRHDDITSDIVKSYLSLSLFIIDFIEQAWLFKYIFT